MTDDFDAIATRECLRGMFDPIMEREYNEQVILASTPDPDSPPCELCGGGLGHYPECPVVTERRAK